MWSGQLQGAAARVGLHDRSTPVVLKTEWVQSLSGFGVSQAACHPHRQCRAAPVTSPDAAASLHHRAPLLPPPLEPGGGPKRLRIILEGESLLNDASGLTLFEVFFHQVGPRPGGHPRGAVARARGAWHLGPAPGQQPGRLRGRGRPAAAGQRCCCAGSTVKSAQASGAGASFAAASPTFHPLPRPCPASPAAARRCTLPRTPSSRAVSGRSWATSC